MAGLTGSARLTISSMLWMVTVILIAAGPREGLAQDSGRPVSKNASAEKGENDWTSVVQDRKFEKSGAHLLRVTAGLIPNDDIHWSLPISLEYGYFITETLAIGLTGAYLLDFDKKLKNSLGNDLDQYYQAQQKLQWRAHITGSWYPIHGKMASVGNTQVSYDLGLKIGLGVIGSSIRKHGEIIEERKKIDFSGLLGIQGMLFLTRYLALTMDVTTYLFMSSGDNFSIPVEISLGLAFLLGTPEKEEASDAVACSEDCASTGSLPLFEDCCGGQSDGKGSIVGFVAEASVFATNFAWGERGSLGLVLRGQNLQWTLGVGAAVKHQDNSFGMFLNGNIRIKSWDKPKVFPRIGVSFTNFSEKRGSGDWTPFWLVGGELGFDWTIHEFKNGELDLFVAVPVGVKMHDKAYMSGAKEKVRTHYDVYYGGTVGLSVLAW